MTVKDLGKEDGLDLGTLSPDEAILLAAIAGLHPPVLCNVRGQSKRWAAEGKIVSGEIDRLPDCVNRDRFS